MEQALVQCKNCGASSGYDNHNELGFCGYCGTKLELQKSAQKSTRGSVEINESNIEKLLKMAEEALDDNKEDEAIKYYNKVLELDSENWQAIFGKGLASAWKTTLEDIRLSDATDASDKVSDMLFDREMEELITEQESNAIRNSMAMRINEVIVATVALAAQHYEEIKDLEDAAEDYWMILGDADYAMFYCIMLIKEEAARKNSEYRENRIVLLDNQIKYQVEKCKTRRFIDSNGKYTYIWIDDYTRKNSIETYDECVSLIKKLDPNYQPPEIERSKPKKSGCYIATAVYGSYEAPEVMVLRKFRDEVLAKSLLGRLFIKTYYFLSPPIADRLKNTKRINKMVKVILDKIVKKL